MIARKRAAPAAVLLLLALFAPGRAAVGAEELRTIVAGTVSLSPEASEGSRLSIGYNDGVAILLSKDSPFIQGFEIELKSPQAALAFPGALAYELWRRVDPLPDKNRYGYEGSRILTQPLPARAGIVIQVPVRKDHSLKSGPYATLLPVVAEPKDFPLVFRLFPVTKGLSPELEAAQFQVRVRPILTDEGALRLMLRYPEGAERSGVAVFVDDKRLPEGRYQDGKELLPLKAGSHSLRVSSDSFRDESRSFQVEQGRILELAVELQDTMPLLVLEAPDSAQLSLDGARIDFLAKPSFAVEPGEHNLSCRIGDYVVSRKFTAYRGKTYRLVLSVELQLQESP